MRRRRRVASLLLALGLAASPGCRALGELGDRAFSWGASTYLPNPVAVGFYCVGMGVGFLVAAPLSLISWPLAALTMDEGDPFGLEAALFPGLVVGTGVGALLGLPFLPFGWPFLPDEPPPPVGPDSARPAPEPAASDEAPR